MYVREIARVEGKPKVINQVYIGSPAKVAAMAKGQAGGDVKLRVEEFGALFAANLMDEGIDLAAIIDSVVPRGAKETGPTVGEYFLYSALNRMVEAVSKHALPRWYAHTAISQIRPVNTSELTSQRYWEKWDRVSEEDLAEISRLFFERVTELGGPGADCLLFDTTNYYTYLATKTPSELAKRGHNKESKHHLRQVGLGLLVEREGRLPLWWRAYPGNLHDSRLFADVLEEMFSVVATLPSTKRRLTLVMDKGMNAEGNFRVIDAHRQVHFVTTHSLYHAPDLASVPLSKYSPLATEKNQELEKEGSASERLRAFRTTGEYWGQERTVVLTYNPATARKQGYVLEEKLAEVREELLSARAKVRGGAPHWRDPERIRERYFLLCEKLRISPVLYELTFEQKESGLKMEFRKNQYEVQKRSALFGKNMIVTDNSDWTTEEIVQASLDRWGVEDCFRQSKDEDLVGVQPIRHFTDSKIRCHLFCCVVALTYLRMLEKKLSAAGVKRTAAGVMEDLNHFHSVLSISDRGRKPVRRLEEPSKTQAEALKALGYQVSKGGVLQLLGS